jgi:hypothetical protein
MFLSLYLHIFKKYYFAIYLAQSTMCKVMRAET